MTASAKIEELKHKFDVAVKTAIASGAHPETAVTEAAKILGLRFTPEVEQNIINTIKLAQAQNDPAHRLRVRVLSRAIQQELHLGHSPEVAIRTALEQTGIKISPEAEASLVESHERQGQFQRDLLTVIDVVPEREFDELTGRHCIDFSLDNKMGWSCCRCSQHNPRREIACIMCGHGRCEASS